jgi:DNA-binding NtrC family response regulator
MIPEAPSTPRILLVDDEIQQLWLRAQVMTLSGFPVLTADSPNVALSMVAEEAIEKVELVVLDYQMPDMNGCDLADLLKEMAPDLKIILYSGATDIPCSEMSSIDVFVSKGDGISRLIAEVARLSEIGPPTAFMSNLTLHSGAQA